MDLHGYGAKFTVLLKRGSSREIEEIDIEEGTWEIEGGLTSNCINCKKLTVKLEDGNKYLVPHGIRNTIGRCLGTLDEI